MIDILYLYGMLDRCRLVFADMPRMWTDDQLSEIYLDGIKVQIDQRRDPIFGYASKWNYEANQWK